MYGGLRFAFQRNCKSTIGKIVDCETRGTVDAKSYRYVYEFETDKGFKMVTTSSIGTKDSFHRHNKHVREQKKVKILYNVDDPYECSSMSEFYTLFIAQGIIILAGIVYIIIGIFVIN